MLNSKYLELVDLIKELDVDLIKERLENEDDFYDDEEDTSCDFIDWYMKWVMDTLDKIVK